jgi:hypothetical protein
MNTLHRRAVELYISVRTERRIPERKSPPDPEQKKKVRYAIYHPNKPEPGRAKVKG